MKYERVFDEGVDATGSRRPADRCDIDHIARWEAGGATVQQNGRVLRPFHNHLRQHHPGRAGADDP